MMTDIQKKTLRYCLIGALKAGVCEHPQIDVTRLGITFEEYEGIPIADIIILRGCTNVPEVLPPYIREIKEDRRDD
jgi:hypothetical protein